MRPNGMRKMLIANAMTVVIVVAGCGAEKTSPPKENAKPPAASEQPKSGPQLIAPTNEKAEEPASGSPSAANPSVMRTPLLARTALSLAAMEAVLMQATAKSEPSGPQPQKAFYRAETAAQIPPVTLPRMSKAH